MRPTRRGVVAGLATLGAFVAGATFGARALNAVAAPALVALGYALVAVWRADRPGVERLVPPPGHPGETRQMRFNVDAGGRVELEDRLPNGLRPRTYAAAITGAGHVEYEMEYARRGAHDIGPLSLRITDPLGLIAETYRYESDKHVLVYPTVTPITDGTPLARLVDQAGMPDRQAFDRLREYAPGDSLRDVNWKTTAKYGDMVVTEFAAEDQGAVSVVGEATADGTGENADAMAGAVASLVVFLLDMGIEVELVVPGGELEAGLGDTHRQAALDLLARTPPGRVSDEAVARADVHVLADGETNVDVRGIGVEYTDLVGGREVAA
ncbi:DUF58 domain-containing protein [Halomarina oriensis]|uniref:DUF58 domain-containing protein n=1 Tax=Halomarina oriensis TaxID=671145 RepID=A0A6B0GWX9_9EURY|nr:DUF58 domain-containing protein [Halomarina oriensis]MWG36645.1 DUF58 domain-containing protein [Halomarina oriensis]